MTVPRLFCSWLTTAFALVLCVSATAQDKAAPVRELAPSLALYQGADRQAKLLEAAKKEGELLVYHVYPNLTLAMAAFTKKYGIKVKAWRAGSEAVLQRVVTEARGNRFDVDIIQNNAPEMEATHLEKLLQEVRSPFLSELIPQALPKHGEWVGITIDIWTAAYNTNKVSKAELPRSYADMQDPKWKGRLGIEANNHGWFGTLLGELGEEAGVKIFNDIVATNGISARKGHSLLTTLVASGDVPFALTVYNWNPEQLKAKGGAPIEGHWISPVIAQPSTIALARRAPNPASGLLFHDFLLSEGQKLLADNSYLVTSKKLHAPPPNVAIKYIDPARALEMNDKWQKQFDEMIVKKAR